MPWLFTMIPEFLKKRACRYLLQHYLGQYLEQKIQLEDLTVDLYNGTGTITNVPLNVEVNIYITTVQVHVFRYISFEAYMIVVCCVNAI